MAFPTSIPSYTITAGGDTPNNTAGGIGLSGLLNAFEVDITALGTKVGTGSSTPTNNTVLAGNGTGTSTWTATLTNFTFVTPTIASFVNANHNHSNTAGGGQLTASAFANNAITAQLLDTAAISLGYAQILSNFSTASTSPVQITGLTSTVTIPAGGRRVKITCYIYEVYNTTATASVLVSLWDGAVGAGTEIATSGYTSATASAVSAGICMAVATPSAGSKTYNVGLQTVGGGTANTAAASTAPSFILVEAI